MTTVRPVRPDEHEMTRRNAPEERDSDEYRTALTDVASRLGDDTVVLVAVDGGEVVGSVTVVGGDSEHFEHPRHGDGGFRMLAVAPSAQGRGVGRALLDAAVAHARAEGWRRLAITTMGWMASAQAMYETAGFVRRADLDVRYASGVGLGYVLDLTDEPPVFQPHDQQPPGC